jgi:hypothetical protein
MPALITISITVTIFNHSIRMMKKENRIFQFFINQNYPMFSHKLELKFVYRAFAFEALLS